MRPRHLYRNGRPLLLDSPVCLLYRRIPCTHVDGQQIEPTGLRLPNLSVLRGDLIQGHDDARWLCMAQTKEGQAEYDTSCVFAFPAGAIPSQRSDAVGKVFVIRPVHDPCDDLYPHYEVRFNLAAAPETPVDRIPLSLTKLIKQIICDAVTEVWSPAGGTAQSEPQVR